MKKILLYSLMLLSAVTFWSCSDDDNIASEDGTNRLPRPMFRKEENTGMTNDPFESTVVDINNAQLYWYNVNGAVAYEIKWADNGSGVRYGEEGWIEAEQNGKLMGHVVVLAPKWSLYVPNLQYSLDHRFAIRALNSFDAIGYPLFNGEDGVYDILGSGDTNWKNDPVNSKWYGYGNDRQWSDFMSLIMKDRSLKYSVPTVVQTSEWTETSFHLTLNRVVDETTYTNADELASIREHFNFLDEAKTILKVDYITVTASATTPDATENPTYVKYDIPESAWSEDNTIELDITGLSKNSTYDINAWDSSIPVTVDASYNVPRARKTKGPAGAPILIAHVPNATATFDDGSSFDISAYNSMELDAIIEDYCSNIDISENQIYYLEGGKAYHFTRSLSLYKGFTLATNPEDVAQGKRAKLYMSGMTQANGTVNSCNFMLGRQPVSGENPTIPIAIDSLRFLDLDVDCPLAPNYGHQIEGKGSAQGNYFMNMYGDGMGIDVTLLEWRNCSFQGLIRGFFRIQGNNDFNIQELNLINCDFYNCGYYSNSAGDYAYIFADHGDKTKSNILNDVEVSGCVFYNNPKRSVITDNNKNIFWDSSVRWNIDVHHNTFVNFCTIAANPILNTRYIPGGSVLGFHDNLIILTKDPADVNRAMNSAGWDAREIQGGDGSGECIFNIYNNWTTNDTEYLTNGQPFGSYALSATSNTPGKWQNTYPQNFPYGTSELVVHLEENLRATDLMVSPNPTHFVGPDFGSMDYHTDNGIDGLYYQQTEKVLNSAVYNSGAGSPRLRNGK